MDQSKLAALSDGPTAATLGSSGVFRSFAKGGIVPSEAQKEAGNYRKGHVRVHGMDLSIETPKGEKRSGKGKDGKPWNVTMPAHYGYIRGTKGADGDHVDAYLGPHPGNPNVHVVDQVDADTRKFDEHKALLGFQSRQHALDHYHRGFSDGRGKDRVGAVTTMPAHKFRSWVEKGRRTRPLGTLRIDRTHDDPYLAGISQDKRTLEIDRRVPNPMVVKGKSFDPAKYLAIHEQVEREYMDKGMKYEPAHRIALKAEKAAVEADGIDWNGYQEQMHKLAAITQREPAATLHPPTDLFKGPFPRREKALLTKRGDTAPDGVKGYAEGGKVEGDEGVSQDDAISQGFTPVGVSREDAISQGFTPVERPEYSTVGEMAKRGAQAVLPGLGSIPAMIGGAELGGAAGTAIAPGPGTVIGGLAGAAAGGIAANISLRKLQDWFMDKLGIVPDPEKAAAFQQEHPNLATAADIGGSLVGMSPARGAVSGLQRAVMGAGQAGIQAGSDYLHTGEFDPAGELMAGVAGAAFPSLNKLGSGIAAKVGIRAGRPDMAKGSEPLKQLPAPPDYTTSAEGDTAAYPGGDDQVFSEAIAPRPGTSRENERPIYEMPRSDWTDVTRPGTRPPDNTAPGAENDTPAKTDEDIAADKSAATPAHAGYDPNSTLSTSHEMAPPRKDTNIGNPQSYPAGSERDYRTTTDSNVHPTSSGAGDYPTAEILDPSQGSISQETLAALRENTSMQGAQVGRIRNPGFPANENVQGGGQPEPPESGRINFSSTGATRKRAPALGDQSQQNLIRPVPEAPKPIPSAEEGEAFNRATLPTKQLNERKRLTPEEVTGNVIERQPVGTEVPEHPNTGIVEGAVADTAAKLRERDLPQIAEAVEKNPNIEPQARRILQDLTAPPTEGGTVDAEIMRRGMRAMEAAKTPEERDRAMQLMEQARNPALKEQQQEVATKISEQRKTQPGRLATLEDGTTVAAPTPEAAREMEGAAKAAKAAFDKHVPTDNKIPTTQVDKDLFVQRLKSALDTAKEENLGKDPLSPMPRKRTAAQEWLKAAQKLVNAKRVTPAMISKFMGDEQMMRAGAKGSEIRGFNRVEADVEMNRRKQGPNEDPIDTAMRQWVDTLPPEDKAQWESELANTSDPNGDEYEHDTSAGKKKGLDDYESQKSTGAEYYGGLLRDMFRDDAGVFRPQAFLASLRGVFGPKARLYAESYRARAPEGAKEEYARSVDDGLNRLQKMEGGVWLDRQRDAAAMSDVIKSNDEKIYLAHERDDIASLSPDEKAAYYQKGQPFMEENDHIFRQIEQIHPGLLGPKVENHIQRIPQGYHPDFGGDPVANVTAARKRGLSTMTGTLKHREFMALEDPQGNRTVISPTENGYAEWNNHVSAQRQNAAFEPEPGVQFRDHNGVLQTVKDVLTPEIEQHANFSNGQPARYVKSFILSALATNAELRNTLSRLQYLQSLKSEMVSQGMATPDGKQAERKGWQKSIMPQFKDMYMTDHLRAVMDDFAAPGLTSNEAWDRVRAFSEKVTKLMFLDPLFHLFNVGTHAFVDRGWDWIKPEKLKVLASTTAQAIASVRNQDLLQDTLYEHGAGLQYRGVLNQNRLMNIFTAAGHAIASNPSKWDPIARVMGMSAKELGASVYRNSSKVMWAGNDIFYTQRVLERMHDGANMEQAIMQTEKHFPNYRVPSYVIGANDWGRLASRMLRDNTLFAFGPYHYGVFNSYAHIVKDAVKGNGQERIDAAGKLFAMGLLGFAVYPALDKIARAATSNDDAEFRRRGPLTLPNHIVRAYQGKEDALNTGPQGTLTISPMAQGVMQQGANRDFAGRPINEPGDVTQAMHGPNRMQALGKVVTQRVASMAKNFISPYAMAGRAIEDAHSPLRGLIAQVADIKNPSPKAVRYEREAAQINKQKALTRQQHGGLSWEEGLYNKITR